MRLGFIDNAKAIAIVLVLFGHTDGVPEPLLRFIYAFHMPAFFFLSGYLLKDSRLTLGVLEFVKTQAKTLIAPYLFFCAVSITYAIPNSIVKGVKLDLPTELAGVLWGNASGLSNTVLWFLTCLFSTSIIYYLLAKVFARGKLLIASLLISLVTCSLLNASTTRTPWNLDLALVALAFFAGGKFLADRSINRLLGATIPLKIAVIVFGSALLLYSSSIAGRVDMAFMVFGTPAFFMLNAWLGIALLLALASSLPVTRLSSFLAKSTIVIFPLHPIFFSVFTGIAMVIFGATHEFQENLLWSFIYTAGALILSYPSSLFLFAYFPAALGAAPRNERRSVN